MFRVPRCHEWRAYIAHRAGTGCRGTLWAAGVSARRREKWDSIDVKLRNDGGCGSAGFVHCEVMLYFLVTP